MSISRPTLAALILLAVTPAPSTAQTMETRTYHAVAHGPTVVLPWWSCWFGQDKGCKYAPCHMHTVQAPRLGVLTPSVVPGQIPARAGVCAGKPVPVMTLTYSPKPDVHGADQIILETHSDNGLSHRIEISVDVP